MNDSRAPSQEPDENDVSSEELEPETGTAQGGGEDPEHPAEGTKPRGNEEVDFDRLEREVEELNRTIGR